MTKIDIFSGFLGAGKTTLIKKLISDGFNGQKLVLIENEFGQIGIDGGFLQECGIQITEMNSGCICCSLVGDFSKALRKVIDEYAPDRILIEPSGVGKLSDVIRAVQTVITDDVELASFTTVADAGKCKMYMKNFGEFYDDQIANAGCIVLSHTAGMSDAKIAEVVALLREKNATATIVTTDWDSLSGGQIIAAITQTSTLNAELARLAADTESEDEDEDEDEDEHHHHHDDDGDDDDEHEHHHDDDDDDGDDGDGHEHHHHHHHHADDVFTSWGVETPVKFTPEQIQTILSSLGDEEKYGVILRSKGIVPGQDGRWIHFDYVPGEPDVRTGPASVIGRICVIGSGIHKQEIAGLFGVPVK